MRKLFKERKLFKGGNYMRKYGRWEFLLKINKLIVPNKCVELGFFLIF